MPTPKPFLPARQVRALLAAYVILLTTSLLLPGQDVQPVQLNDKAVHFVAFFVLSYFIDRSFSPRAPILFAVLTSYALLTEALQSFVPGRSCSLYDLFADFFGIVVYYLVTHRRVLTKRFESGTQ